MCDQPTSQHKGALLYAYPQLPEESSRTLEMAARREHIEKEIIAVEVIVVVHP